MYRLAYNDGIVAFKMGRLEKQPTEPASTGRHHHCMRDGTLATPLLQALRDHGAHEIFGIPGDFVLPFFKVIEESRILPHYTLSHEPWQGIGKSKSPRCPSRGESRIAQGTICQNACASIGVTRFK